LSAIIYVGGSSSGTVLGILVEEIKMAKTFTKTYSICVVYSYDDNGDITESDMNVQQLRTKIKKAIANCVPVGQGRINAQPVRTVSEI